MAHWGKAIGLLAICLTWCASSQMMMDPEPEPMETYTTSNEPEPEPSSETTTTVAQVVHTVTVSVAFSNISALSDEAALIAYLMQGVTAVSGASTNVTVEIHHIVIDSTYGGLPEINVDNVIEAYATMTNIDYTVVRVTVNGQTHSSPNAARRLSNNANTKAQVENSASVDIVTEAQRISDSQSAAAFLQQLINKNSSIYSGINITFPNPPTSSISATTKITGTNVIPSEQDLANQIASKIPGGATVSASVNTTGLNCDLSLLGCQTVANSMNLAQGGLSWPMAGSYSETGCYYYTAGEFKNMAFYGYVNGQQITSESQLSSLASPKQRLCGEYGGTVPPTTTPGSQGSTGGSQANTTTSSAVPEEDHAVSASMTTIWVVVCAFALS